MDSNPHSGLPASRPLCSVLLLSWLAPHAPTTLFLLSLPPIDIHLPHAVRHQLLGGAVCLFRGRLGHGGPADGHAAGRLREPLLGRHRHACLGQELFGRRWCRPPFLQRCFSLLKGGLYFFPPVFSARPAPSPQGGQNNNNIALQFTSTGALSLVVQNGYQGDPSFAYYTLAGQVLWHASMILCNVMCCDVLM